MKNGGRMGKSLSGGGLGLAEEFLLEGLEIGPGDLSEIVAGGGVVAHLEAYAGEVDGGKVFLRGDVVKMLPCLEGFRPSGYGDGVEGVGVALGEGGIEGVEIGGAL